MHLEPGCKETGNGNEHGAEHNTYHQGQEHPGQNRHGAEVKGMSEHGAGVGAIVHDYGCGGHAHAHHTANGQVGAGQEDQAGYAKGQEHSG